MDALAELFDDRFQGSVALAHGALLLPRRIAVEQVRAVQHFTRVAVVVREGFSEISVKAVLLATVFLVFSPVVAHVLGRAARLREHGDLRARSHETEVDES